MVKKSMKTISEKPVDETVYYKGEFLKIVETPELKNLTSEVARAAYRKTEEYEAYRQSVRGLSGMGKLDHPIEMTMLYEKGEKYLTIVDGYTRYEWLKSLGFLPIKDENYTVLNLCLEDAIAYARRANYFRTEHNAYQKAVVAINANPADSDETISKGSGVTRSTITKVRELIEMHGCSMKATYRTETEKTLIQDIMLKVETGEKGFGYAYDAFKTAKEVSEVISKIEDSEFKAKMLKDYEIEKFTNKNALKQLQVEVQLYELKKEGKYEPTPYDKKLYPIMSNLIKLSNNGYTEVKTVTYSGSQPSIDNALNTIQSYLKENMDENLIDILEAVRSLIIKEYEETTEGHGNVPKDLSVIMAKITKIFKESKVDYFATVMRKPNNPKGKIEG